MRSATTKGQQILGHIPLDKIITASNIYHQFDEGFTRKDSYAIRGIGMNFLYTIYDVYKIWCIV